jgi:hypothetical protein
MPRRTRARQLLDELVRQLRLRSAHRSHLQTAEMLSADCDNSKERVRAAAPDTGTLLYLVSLGLVATAIVVVFFGLGFFLLAHPGDEAIAAAELGDRGAAVGASSSSVFLAQPGDTHERAPPAVTGDAASDPSPEVIAGWQATSASFGVPRPEQPGLASNEEASTPVAAVGAPRTKTAASARHRHNGARKHWASAYRSGTYARPAPVSGPEVAWRWIVHSANNLLAALSPPPPPQTAGFRTR